MLEDEILTLKQENTDLTEKIRKLVYYLNRYKEDKDLLSRQLQEKEDELEKTKEKLNMISYSKSKSKSTKSLNEINEKNYSDFIYSKERTDLVVTFTPLLHNDNKNKEENISREGRKTDFISKLTESIKEKNDLIERLTEENKELKMKFEEIKEKEQINFKFILKKLSKDSFDEEFIASSKEISRLKYENIRFELKNKEMKSIIDVLTEEKNCLNKNIELLKLSCEKNNKNHSQIVNETQFPYIINSKLNLIDNLRLTSTILDRITRENIKIRHVLLKQQEDFHHLQHENLQLESKNIELSSEIEKFEITVKGNLSEIEYLKDKLQSLRVIIDEIQLSKKSYIVSYVYLGLSYEAKIFFEKEEEGYSFRIETKLSTRRLNWLDYEVYISNENSCVVFKSKLDGSEEEYFTEDYLKIYNDFELFKKKSIETSTFKTVNTLYGSQTTIIDKKDKDKKNFEEKTKKLQDIFGF